MITAARRCMRQQVKRAGRITVGILCLILGVFGLFLPFLQGILFLALGLSLLSTESETARRLLHRLKQSRMVPERWREHVGDGSVGEGVHDGQR